MSVRMVAARSEELVELWSGTTDASGVAQIALSSPAELLKREPPRRVRYVLNYTHLIILLEHNGGQRLLAQTLSIVQAEQLGVAPNCAYQPPEVMIVLRKLFAQHAIRHAEAGTNLCVSEDVTDDLNQAMGDPARHAWIVLLGIAWLVLALFTAWATARELRREMFSITSVSSVVMMSALKGWTIIGGVLVSNMSGPAPAGVALCVFILAILCGWLLARKAQYLMSPLKCACVVTGLLLWIILPFISQEIQIDFDWFLGGMFVLGVVSLGVLCVHAWRLRTQSGLWRWLGLSLLCVFLSVQVFILHDALYVGPLPERAILFYAMWLCALYPGIWCWPLILMHYRRWSTALAVSMLGYMSPLIFLFSVSRID